MNGMGIGAQAASTAAPEVVDRLLEDTTAGWEGRLRAWSPGRSPPTASGGVRRGSPAWPSRSRPAVGCRERGCAAAQVSDQASLSAAG